MAQVFIAKTHMTIAHLSIYPTPYTSTHKSGLLMYDNARYDAVKETEEELIAWATEIVGNKAGLVPEFVPQ